MSISRQLGRLVSAAALVCGTSAAAAADAPKQTIGWLEDVTIVPGNVTLRAKMDTGARIASLSATDIESFERDGDAWVRFVVVADDNGPVLLERPLKRYANIKAHQGPSQVRPVVMLTLCLGTEAKEAEVNLIDRSRFNYPLLVGRAFLRGAYVIDPQRRFSLRAQASACEMPV